MAQVNRTCAVADKTNQARGQKEQKKALQRAPTVRRSAARPDTGKKVSSQRRKPCFPAHAFLPCYIAIGLGSPRQSGNLFPTGSSVLQEEKGAESKIPQKRTAALRQLPHTDFSCVRFPKSRRILRKHHFCLRRNYRSAAEKAAAGTFRAGQRSRWAQHGLHVRQPSLGAA